ncbi:MAG TPA: hypothetical protein VGH33_26070, partial [Isosphaeraceae bacterium]
AGRTAVSTSFRPTRLTPALALSIAGLGANALALAALGLRRARSAPAPAGEETRDVRDPPPG